MNAEREIVPHDQGPLEICLLIKFGDTSIRKFSVRKTGKIILREVELITAIVSLSEREI